MSSGGRKSVPQTGLPRASPERINEASRPWGLFVSRGIPSDAYFLRFPLRSRRKPSVLPVAIWVAIGMTTRRFPPPWTVEQMPGGFKVLDANGQAAGAVWCGLRSRRSLAIKARLPPFPSNSPRNLICPSRRPKKANVGLSGDTNRKSTSVADGSRTSRSRSATCDKADRRFNGAARPARVYKYIH